MSFGPLLAQDGLSPTQASPKKLLKMPWEGLSHSVTFGHFPSAEEETVRTGKCLRTFGLSPLLEGEVETEKREEA